MSFARHSSWVLGLDSKLDNWKGKKTEGCRMLAVAAICHGDVTVQATAHRCIMYCPRLKKPNISPWPVLSVAKKAAYPLWPLECLCPPARAHNSGTQAVHWRQQTITTQFLFHRIYYTFIHHHNRLMGRCVMHLVCCYLFSSLIVP